MKKFFEKTLHSEKIFQGKVFEVEKDEVELSDGMKTSREVVRHTGGVTTAAVKDDKILLVRQFRYPQSEVMYELPAGKLKTGENPLLAAKRELLEETGYIAEKWTDLGIIHPSPGFLQEILHLYLAEDLEFKGPNPDEGEIIECYEIDRQKVFKMIKTGEINDAKSICAITRAFLL